MVFNNGFTKKFASFEEAKKYFREQIKRLHPDKGGNKEAFLELLEIYHKFLKEHREKAEVKVVKNISLTGNYFFSVLDLSVEEVALGCKKRVKVPVEEVICSACNGTGKRMNGNGEKCGFCKGTGFVEIKKENRVSYLTCPYCNGYGYIFKERCEECKGRGKIRITKEIEFSLPFGVKHGDIIFVSKGFAGTKYDLYFEVNILPHPYFSIEENTLVYKLRLPFWDVILKEEIRIHTLEGEETLPSSMFLKGEAIRIKGRGPFVSESERGDLLIKFEFYIPENIPEEAKSLISQAVKIIQNHQ